MLDSKELAINGGTPVRTKPWMDNFTIGEEEKRAVLDVLDSGYLSLFEGSHMPDAPFDFWGGPKVQELEREWAAFYGAAHAVSMNSATSGLYASIGALGLGFGDEVIVSPYTMSACAVCALVYGAIPIFADVDLATGCLDPDSVEAHVTERTQAILVVHQFGIPADMDGIMAVARRHNLRVIEDCAQAHGARYKGRAVGTIGDIGVFSLNVNKTIQTGEGGVCVTADEELRYRLALIRNHGEQVVAQSSYEAITNMVGFNYRLTEIGAAMAIEQLKKLPALNETRAGFVAYMTEALSGHEHLITPPLGDGTDGSAYGALYVYPLRYREEVLGVPRADFARALQAEGVPFGQGYVRPLYLQPVYQRKLAFKFGYPFSAPENRDAETNYHEGACPNAERLHFHEMLVNEHVRPPHTLDDMRDIISALDKVAQ